MKFSTATTIGALACAAALVPTSISAADTCDVCAADAIKAFDKTIAAAKIDYTKTGVGNADDRLAFCNAFNGLNGALDECADCDADQTVKGNAALFGTVKFAAAVCEVKLPVANEAVKALCTTDCYDEFFTKEKIDGMTCESTSAQLAPTAIADNVMKQCLFVCPKSTLHDDSGKGADQYVEKMREFADDDNCEGIDEKLADYFEDNYDNAAGSTGASVGLVASAALLAAVAPKLV